MKTLLLLLAATLAAATDNRYQQNHDYRYPVPIIVPTNPVYHGGGGDGYGSGYQPAHQNYGHGGYRQRDSLYDDERRAQVRGLLRLLTEAGVDALVNTIFSRKSDYHKK